MTDTSGSSPPADPVQVHVKVDKNSTVESMLAGLARQGISDLPTFVDDSLAYLRDIDAKNEDDLPLRVSVIISDRFVYVGARGGAR